MVNVIVGLLLDGFFELITVLVNFGMYAVVFHGISVLTGGRLFGWLLNAKVNVNVNRRDSKDE